MNNVNKNIEEAQKSAPILCQAIHPSAFPPGASTLSPSILMIGAEWPTLPNCAEISHMAQALTKTATSNTTTPAAVGISKINSNRAWPTDGQIASPRPPTDPDNDAMLASSFGGSDDIFEYVESTENAPSRSVNTPDLVVHTRDLETMHKVPEEGFNTIVRLRAIFSHIGDLKITELVDAETNLTKT